MEGARLFPILVVLLAAGCRGPADVSFPTYAPEPTPYVPNAGGGNAFDAYVLAAGETESAVASFRIDPLRRSFFTPKQREDIMKALAPAVRRVANAKASCQFHYVPARPGSSLPGRAAWRLLGHALRWRIDDALAEGEIDKALAETGTAFRFAADLCGGGPADRTLGVEIANDIREALLPALSKLDAPRLRRVADSTKSALSRRPPLDQTLVNGDADMRLALQTLQDSYRVSEFASIRTAMGKDFRDIESSLKEMKKKDGPERAAFFSALDGNRERLSAAWHAAAAHPRTRRAEALDVKLKGDKAVKAFARHFFLIGKPLLDIDDRSLALQRLFILEAELRRVVLVSRRAPTSLAAVKPPWAVDPYNGRTFGYQPDGAEFRVYSVGANLRDDLGDTDAAGLDPDIRTLVP